MFHVKHPAGAKTLLTPEDIAEAVTSTAQAMGVQGLLVDSAKAQAIRRLAEEIASAARVGLTSYHDAREVFTGLVLPAVAAFRWLAAGEPLQVVEIGAGSGALGFTLAVLAPDWRVTLLDRREKAVAFMEIAALRLKLANAFPIAADARQPAAGEGYDAALFRAVASPDEDLDLAGHWLGSGGVCLIWTSASLPAPPESEHWMQVGVLPARDSRMSVLAYRRA
jgi:16S rRNA G527 N7-methylase RsmG